MVRRGASRSTTPYDPQSVRFKKSPPARRVAENISRNHADSSPYSTQPIGPEPGHERLTGGLRVRSSLTCRPQFRTATQPDSPRSSAVECHDRASRHSHAETAVARVEIENRASASPFGMLGCASDAIGQHIPARHSAADGDNVSGITHREGRSGLVPVCRSPRSRRGKKPSVPATTQEPPRPKASERPRIFLNSNANPCAERVATFPPYAHCRSRTARRTCGNRFVRSKWPATTKSIRPITLVASTSNSLPGLTTVIVPSRAVR